MPILIVFLYSLDKTSNIIFVYLYETFLMTVFINNNLIFYYSKL